MVVAYRVHRVNGELVSVPVPVCRCEAPVRSLWHGDCSHCRGAVLEPGEEPVGIR